MKWWRSVEDCEIFGYSRFLADCGVAHVDGDDFFKLVVGGVYD